MMGWVHVWVLLRIQLLSQGIVLALALEVEVLLVVLATAPRQDSLLLLLRLLLRGGGEGEPIGERVGAAAAAATAAARGKCCCDRAGVAGGSHHIGRRPLLHLLPAFSFFLAPVRQVSIQVCAHFAGTRPAAQSSALPPPPTHYHSKQNRSQYTKLVYTPIAHYVAPF